MTRLPVRFLVLLVGLCLACAGCGLDDDITWSGFDLGPPVGPAVQTPAGDKGGR